ncbi:MAG: hypothetical protein ACYTFG_06670, partial [Planctomycetota bacterium]
MRHDHEILKTPLPVPHRQGQIKVQGSIPETQAEMGEALTLEGIVNTIEVLERRLSKTRHSPYTYLALAKYKHPGFIRTLAQYLPEDISGKGVAETEAWLEENLPYLYAPGRRFQLDLQAKALSIPNHRREILERCIADLKVKARYRTAFEILKRYTGVEDLGASSKAWQKWFDENREYLFFSDIGGFKFLVDEDAKSKSIPTAKLRGWTSESIDYRAVPAVAGIKEKDLS